MNIRKLLSLGSQTAPKVIDDLVDPTKALIKKGAMEADEIVGEAAKRSPVIDDIMDAELIQKANRAKMDPRLAALLGGTGLGAAGIAMMGGDEPPIDPPMAKKMETPEQPEAFPYDEMDAGAQAEALSMPQDVSQKAKTGLQDPGLRAASEALDRGMVGLKEVPPPSSPTDQESPEAKALREAQEKDDYEAALLGMLRGANQIGSAISMTQADQSGVEALEKTIGQRQRNVKSQIAAKAEVEKNKMLSQENEDLKSLRDPNSNISKFYRDQFGKFLPGIGQNTSAFDMQKALPSLVQLTSTKLAADSRLESAEDKAKAKAESEKDKKLNSHIDTYNKTLQKPYETFAKAQTNVEAMNNILGMAANQTTPGAKDIAMLYTFIKTMDPDSVVRESEIGLSKSAMSLIGKIKAGTKQITGGDLLDNDSRKAYEEIIKVYADAQQNRFRRAKNNAIAAGKEKGLDPEVLDRALYPEVTALKKEAQSEQKQTVKLGSQKKPGSIITTKSGKTYQVNSDGLTATEQ